MAFGSNCYKLQDVGALRFIALIWGILLLTIANAEEQPYMYKRAEVSSNDSQQQAKWEVSNPKFSQIMPQGYDPRVNKVQNPDVSNWAMVFLKEGLDEKVVNDHMNWMYGQVVENPYMKNTNGSGTPEAAVKSYMGEQLPQYGVHYLYRTGYSGRFPPEVVEELKKRPEVLMVEGTSYVESHDFKQEPIYLPKQKMTTVKKTQRDPFTAKTQAGEGDEQITYPNGRPFQQGDNSPEMTKAITETGASNENGLSWGLDRIGQTELPFDGSYNSPEPQGRGVELYIMDSGVRGSHQEFSGRLKDGISLGEGGGNTNNGSMDSSKSGHGTHVAGIAAGASVGVAPQVDIVSVGVMGFDGTARTDTIIMGMNWVLNRAATTKKPSVINMSFGIPSNVKEVSRSLEMSTQSLIRNNVVVVASAGNSADPACTSVPARLSSVITVSSSDFEDHRSDFSNYGQCANIYAPGSMIKSASSKDNNGYALLSGTSMASPYVAGAAALHLSQFLNSTVQDVKTSLVARANMEIRNGTGSPGASGPEKAKSRTINGAEVGRLLYIPSGDGNPAPAQGGQTQSAASASSNSQSDSAKPFEKDLMDDYNKIFGDKKVTRKSSSESGAMKTASPTLIAAISLAAGALLWI